ncbi:MAG: hypothetical protein AAF290_02885 [Pseudomonadota bacterium]
MSGATSPRPLLLAVVAIGLHLITVLWSLIFVLCLLISDESSLTIDDWSVQMADIRVFVATGIAVVGFVTWRLARGLWRGIPSARRWFFLGCAVLPTLGLGLLAWSEDELSFATPLVPICLWLWWYLFRKQAVRDFFGDVADVIDPLAAHLVQRTDPPD